VFALTIGLAVGATTVKSHLPQLQGWGGVVGAGVSGTFLWIIGVLNLLVLLDIARAFRASRRGAVDEEELEARLLERGLMNRFFLARLGSRIRSSWHMYPSASSSGSASTPQPRSACS